jgi:hypothetical protein
LYEEAEKMSETTEIVEAPLVSPANPKKVLEVMKLFEEFKKQALTSNDFVVLDTREGKHPYIKKSGWMKYALACQLSLEKRDERVDETPSGKVYHYTYRASAPNGRFADAVGSAATTERQFAHPDHDVRALAQTRACNRAISNLVAGGEVSAEEMVSEIDVQSGISKAETVPQSNKPSPNPKPQTITKVEPKSETAWKVPVTPNQASPEQTNQGVRQIPLVKGVQSFGMVNVLADEISLVPEHPIPVDTALINGFLLPRVVEPLVAKCKLGYTIQRANNGYLEAILIRGKLDEPHIKELVSGARWAFEKSLEEKKT